MRYGVRGRLDLAFCWTGAALFFISIAFCWFRYETTMGRPAGDPRSAAGAIAFNVALFAAFAVHHSVFARDPVRTAVQELVSQRLERSVYVWVASALLVIVVSLWRPVAGIAWQVSGIGGLLLRAGQVAGIWLIIRGAAVIDVFELAGLRQIAHPESQVPKGDVEFKTTGPYGRVRHPIYAGWLLIVFCEPSMTATRLTFAVASGVYLLIGIVFEERSLRGSTAGAYDRYMQQVRWKLVPFLYGLFGIWISGFGF